MFYQSKKQYPHSNVYVNKLGIRDPEQLNKAERQLTAIRQIELDVNPLTTEKWDLKYLQRIHKYIFQDIYNFAGEIRQEQIQKGSTHFANPLYIEPYSKEIFTQLKQEKYLKNLSKDVFCDRLAFYMGEINMIHPFL